MVKEGRYDARITDRHITSDRAFSSMAGDSAAYINLLIEKGTERE
jgi:hypothetical protein